MKRVFIFVLLFASILATSVQAQDYHFGLRAGYNYSRMLGPQINETTHQDRFGWNNGIHFGVTFAYHLTDNFGFRTELAYNQVGTIYEFTSDNAPYVFRNGFERHPRNGEIIRTYDISNSYIHLPLMVFGKPHRKLELYGGFYTQFLIIPSVGGSIDFTDRNPEGSKATGDLKNYSFFQSIEGNYYTDMAREPKGNQSLLVSFYDEEDITTVSMQRLVGAFYELDEDEVNGSPYNWFDAGLEAGFSYFINNSLYVGFTAMYGLTDASNNRADVDYFNLNEFNKYIFRSDFDRNFSTQLSLGFKF